MAGFINFEDIIKNFFKDKVKELQTKGQLQMRFTIEDIIEEWYGEFNGGPMIATFNYDSPQAEIDNFQATITFSAWSDPAMYHGVNGSGWAYASNHGFGDIEDFVYDLQMYQGIIGLPEYASVWESNHPGEPPYNRGSWSHGHNMHFHQKEPLIGVLPNSGLWSRWENIMLSILAN